MIEPKSAALGQRNNNFSNQNLQYFKPDPSSVAQKVIDYDLSQNQNLKPLPRKQNNQSNPPKPKEAAEDQQWWKKTYSPLRKIAAGNTQAQSYAQ